MTPATSDTVDPLARTRAVVQQLERVVEALRQRDPESAMAVAVDLAAIELQVVAITEDVTRERLHYAVRNIGLDHRRAYAIQTHIDTLFGRHERGTCRCHRADADSAAGEPAGVLREPAGAARG